MEDKRSIGIYSQLEYQVDQGRYRSRTVSSTIDCISCFLSIPCLGTDGWFNITSEFRGIVEQLELRSTGIACHDITELLIFGRDFSF